MKRNAILDIIKALHKTTTSMDKVTEDSLESITNINVNVTDAPEESAVRGLVKIVSDSKYRKLPFTMKK